MSKEYKNTDSWVDDLIGSSLIPEQFSPSVNFADRVMQKIDQNKTMPSIGVLKLAFKIAASIAIVFFISNVVILVSSSRESVAATSQPEEWDVLYENQSVNTWYEFYTEDLKNN